MIWSNRAGTDYTFGVWREQELGAGRQSLFEA